MGAAVTLMKRNLKLYSRDKTAVFFSFLSVLIIIGLNMFFLQKMNVDGIAEKLPLRRAEAEIFIKSWVLAGIIITATATVTLSMLGIIIEDQERMCMKSFMTSPVSRAKLMLGYVLSAVVMGCIMSAVTFGISEVFIKVSGGTLLGFIDTFKVFGVILLNVFSNACILFCIVCFIKSTGAFSTFGTIFGTLIGFVQGIYLPVGMLPSVVQSTLKFIPVFQGTAMMRTIFVKDSMAKLMAGVPESIIKQQCIYRGISVYEGNFQFTPEVQSLILIGSGLVFMILSILILMKKKSTDR